MLNFDLKPYEWQNDMPIIMQNIDLTKIEFDNKSILFKFFSANSEEPPTDKYILCNNVWVFSEQNNLRQEDNFPIFICDVRLAILKNSSEIKSAFDYLGYGFDNIPSSREYSLLCIDSGEISIELLCETVVEGIQS